MSLVWGPSLSSDWCKSFFGGTVCNFTANQVFTALMGRKNFFKPIFLKNNKKFSLSISTKKGGPNFTISPIPAFGASCCKFFDPI
jgi:hypothetical protein